MTEIKFWRGFFSILLVISLLFFIFHVWAVILPFAFGIIIAYLVNPLVDNLAAMGLKRSRVVLILYLILLGAGIMLAMTLIPSLIKEANAAVKELPAYTTAIDDLITKANGEIQKFIKPIFKSKSDVIAIPFAAQKFIDSLIPQLPQKILGVAHAGLWIIIIPFVSFFALSHGKSWIDIIFDSTPSEYVENLLGFMAELNATLGGYVRGLIIESLCVGLLTIAGLWAMGIKGAVLLGVITGLVNFVPFMAPLLGGGLALLTAYFQFKSFSVLVGIALLFIGVRLFDDFVLIPFVVGSSVHLHPVIMVFAILAGVEVAGFIGLVFAIPVAVVIKVFLSVALRHRKERLMFRHEHVYS